MDTRPSRIALKCGSRQRLHEHPVLRRFECNLIRELRLADACGEVLKSPQLTNSYQWNGRNPPSRVIDAAPSDCQCCNEIAVA